MKKVNLIKPQFHLLYWIGCVLFFTLIWGTYDHDYGRNLMIQLCSLPSRMILVYGTLWYIVPNFFMKEQHAKSVLYFIILLLIAGVGIQWPVMVFFVERTFLTGHTSENFFAITQLMNTILDVNITAIVPLGYTFFQFWNQSKKQVDTLEKKNLELSKENEQSFIYLKEGSSLHKVSLDSILFIESLKNYIRVKTVDKEITVHKSISAIQETLPSKRFLRVHRSFIVATDHITSFSPAQIDLKGIIVPVGRKYKEAAKEKLGYYLS